jgi:hypothetical protein
MQGFRCAHHASGTTSQDGRHTPARARRLLIAAIAALVVAMLLVFLAAPAPAQAIDIPNPFSILGGAVGGGIGKLAVGAFDAIIKHLFSPIAKFITVELIGWLVAVPDFTQGNVAQLETTVCAMGGGLLGAVATISVARYWAAGFAGGGDSGFSALEGLTRTVGAALLLAMWPWTFSTAINLTNLATSGLLGSASVTDDSARLLAAGLGAAGALNLTGIGVFLNIAIAITASLLFLGLLLLKLVVSISTVLLFVGMPMAIVLWPLVPWIARVAMRAFAVCLMVPFAWALCFAASAALSVNVLSVNGGGGVMDKLLEPLVAIVLLWVMLKLPVTLARVAMLGGQALSGGFVSRAASYAAGRAMSNTVGQALPSGAGGTRTKSTETDGAQGRESRTGGQLRNAANMAGAAAAAAGATGGAGAVAIAASAHQPSAATAATGAGAAGAGSQSGRAYTPPPTARAQAAGHSLQNGLQTPSFAGREQDFANEKFEAGFRERSSPVSGEQAERALRHLPDATQRGIRQLVADQGAGTREHIAYQAMGEWTQGEREALRTLAAASPDVRAQAIDGVVGDGNGTSANTAGAGGATVEPPIFEESEGRAFDAGDHALAPQPGEMYRTGGAADRSPAGVGPDDRGSGTGAPAPSAPGLQVAPAKGSPRAGNGRDAAQTPPAREPRDSDPEPSSFGE